MTEFFSGNHRHFLPFWGFNEWAGRPRRQNSNHTGATMIHTIRKTAGVAGCILLFVASGACAQDWPQWRGPNRDAKASSFEAPKSWPKQLTQKWKVTVGDGVATPALGG